MSQSSELWYVHVRGPENEYPCFDHEEALWFAREVNELCWDWAARNPHLADDMPAVIALVLPWPRSAEEHAEALSKSLRQGPPL